MPGVEDDACADDATAVADACAEDAIAVADACADDDAAVVVVVVVVVVGADVLDADAGAAAFSSSAQRYVLARSSPGSFGSPSAGLLPVWILAMVRA